MKLKELLGVITYTTPIKVVGMKTGTYGFIRGTVQAFNREYRALGNRDVAGVKVTGADHELTVELFGEL